MVSFLSDPDTAASLFVVALIDSGSRKPGKYRVFSPSLIAATVASSHAQIQTSSKFRDSWMARAWRWGDMLGWVNVELFE